MRSDKDLDIFLAMSIGEVSQAVASVVFPSGKVTVIDTRGFSRHS